MAMLSKERGRVLSHTRNRATDPAKPMIYHIRIRGHLGPRGEEWFGHMTITPESNGDTLLTGLVVDPAALHGVLRKVRDLDLPLLSIGIVRKEHTNGNRRNRDDRRRLRRMGGG